MFAFALLVAFALSEGVLGELNAAYTGLVRTSSTFRVKYNDWADTLRFDNVITNVGGLYDSRTGKFTIPYGKDGVYWITVRPDLRSGFATELRVVVNGHIKNYAYGYGVPAGTSFALILQYRDVVEVIAPGESSVEEGTLFSIAQTNANAAFTALHGNDTDYPIGGTVKFGNVITSKGVSYNKATGVITINHEGLYLVNINADGQDVKRETHGPARHYEFTYRLDVFLEVNGYWNVQANGEKSVQSSVATINLLSPGNTLKVKTAHSRRVEENTQVSLVQLQASNSVGFRGHISKNTNRKNPVFFEPNMNLGNMYDPATAIITVPSYDIYIACMRPNPAINTRLDFSLRKNNRRTGVVAYGERGIPNGVCAALELKKGDKLKVIGEDESTVETGSMFVIAPVE